MSKQLYADVLVEVSDVFAKNAYQYQIPLPLLGQINLGNRVLVPFGKREVTGFVVGFSSSSTLDQVKEIISLLEKEPLFNQDQLDLAKWLANYYYCGILKALQSVIAPVLKKTRPKAVERLYSVYQSSQMLNLQQEMSRSPKKLAVLRAVLEHPGLNKHELAVAANVSVHTVQQLCANGQLRVETDLIVRDPYEQYVQTSQDLVDLNADQVIAVNEIGIALEQGVHRVFMLQGATGSGKTEVYLRCIEKTVLSGRQAVTLVPEIALTPQMVRLYKGRFGRKVAVLHSRMSDGERYDEWSRIAAGEAPVILGVRSAVMAPAPDPGLFIIDEEHEPSYKQDEAPRYHARAVALYRMQKNSGVLVLGSATPSLESYCRALPGGEYTLLSMPERINNPNMPQVSLVDMRKETQAGNNGIFSLLLLQKLREKILLGQQAIIFLNRRGFKTLVVCRECGLVLKCPRCEISLTYHTDGKLHCHYCNYQALAPKRCPDCGGVQVGYFGTGTQRVEMDLAAALPGVRILRMDADTTSRKGSHEQILDTYLKGDADILVGTQMIAKGLDLPGVTLVGVINADSSLHMPDFRAAERTFQLLAQVAGRAGRGKIPGEVLVQTYTPEHYAVQSAANHDYLAFFNRELSVRREMNYPPFSKMIRFLFSGKDNDLVRQAAEKVYAALDDLVRCLKTQTVMIVGPAPAPLSRLKDDYRWHIILWSSDYRQLRVLMDGYQQNKFAQVSNKKTKLIIDVDPMYSI